MQPETVPYLKSHAQGGNLFLLLLDLLHKSCHKFYLGLSFWWSSGGWSSSHHRTGIERWSGRWCRGLCSCHSLCFGWLSHVFDHADIASMTSLLTIVANITFVVSILLGVVCLTTPITLPFHEVLKVSSWLYVFVVGSTLLLMWSIYLHGIQVCCLSRCSMKWASLLLCIALPQPLIYRSGGSVQLFKGFYG